MNAESSREAKKNLGDNESINPLKEPLTVEKLRTFEGFESTTDEEALEIICTIDTLCRIVQEYLMNRNRNEHNNSLNIAA